MRLHRALWAGACLLLALAGCSKESDTVKGGGSYSPILTGISSSNEPAARGAPNVLTAQVTNINHLPLTYHWSAAEGVITDTTSASATWTPPDAIGVYDVTVSIEAQDGDIHYFKTLTVHMNVDNQFVRWTRSDAIQFDPAPTSSGGVLYSEYHDPAAGTSDVYRVDTPLPPSPLPAPQPIRLTTGFHAASSPTPRADNVEFAFLGTSQLNDPNAAIYLLPLSGGNKAAARVVTALNVAQTSLASPRFAHVGTRLAYVSDSTVTGTPHVWWRDVSNFNTSPVVTASTSEESPNLRFNIYLNPSWGPDLGGDGNPDSLVATGADLFGFPSGFTLLATPDSGRVVEDRPWLSGDLGAPDWSPDGQYVVFAKKNAGTNEHDIWIINRTQADLSAAVRVTGGPADDTNPRFNSDGSRIFFVSNRVDKYGVNGVFGTERRGRNVWSVAQFDRPQ